MCRKAMLKRIRTVLKDKKGANSLQVVVIFLSLMMVLTVIIEYAGILGFLREIETKAQLTLDGMLMNNAMDLFDSVKNGRSSVKGWQEVDEIAFLNDDTINKDYFIEKLSEQLGLDTGAIGGKSYFRGDSSSPVFIMPEDEIQIRIESDNVLYLRMSLRIGREFVFMGEKVTSENGNVVSLDVPIVVESRYTKMAAISSGQVERGNETTTMGNLLNRNDGVTRPVEGPKSDFGGEAYTPQKGPSAGDFIID